MKKTQEHESCLHGLQIKQEQTIVRYGEYLTYNWTDANRSTQLWKLL